MANVSLKTDFKDGDKLFSQQLNNNFGAIQAALEAMNKIVWQDDPDDMVVTFRGTTEEINSRDIIDGQLLYDTTTGETYIDYGSQRISTGSGNAIFIGDTEPSNPSTQLWINPDEPMQVIGSEIVNSLEGNETNKAPSVDAIKKGIIESGSNENGDYTKYMDGTMICTNKIPINSASIDIQWGNWYIWHDDTIHSFAQPFYNSAPIVQKTLVATSAAGAVLGDYGNSEVSITGFKGITLVRPSTQTVSGYVYVTAIGRWK